MLTYENEGFAFISDRCMIKLRETVYETKIKTELWKLILNMETGISKNKGRSLENRNFFYRAFIVTPK